MNHYFDAKCQLTHISICLREKGLSLVSQHNFLTFIGLGIAPLLILAGVVINNQKALAAILIISGLLSLSNWIWSISVLVYKKDKHIDFCKTLPVQIEAFIQEIESNSGNNGNKRNLARISDKSNRYLIKIRGKLEDEHFTVPDWINIKAQQVVLTDLGAKCSSCGKKWESKYLLSNKEIKNILKKKNNKIFCQKCGQKMN